MKKIILLSAIILMLAVPVSAETQVEQEAKVKDEFSFVVGSPEYTYNGETMLFDQNADLAPYISEVTSQFMIPLRAFAENCGFEVKWDESEPDTVVIWHDQENTDKRLYIYTGENALDKARNEEDKFWAYYGSIALGKGENYSYTLPVAMHSENRNGRMYVPIRDLAGKIGCYDVEWINEEKKAIMKAIPAEELYSTDARIVFENNTLKINMISKNNTDDCIIAPKYPYEVRIYNDKDELVFPFPKQEGLGSGQGFGPTHCDFKPGEGSNLSQKIPPLEAGRYYCDVSWDIDAYRLFRIGEIKCSGSQQFYFELPLNITDETKLFILKTMAEREDYRKNNEAIISFEDITAADSVLAQALSGISYSIKGKLDIINAYVISFNSISSMENAVILLNQNDKVRYAEPNYVYGWDLEPMPGIIIKPTN